MVGVDFIDLTGYVLHMLVCCYGQTENIRVSDHTRRKTAEVAVSDHIKHRRRPDDKSENMPATLKCRTTI